MDLDGFIGFLKGLGVSAKSADEVRAKIEARHPNLQLSFDTGIGDAAQADGERPVGEHSARVLRERRGTGPVMPEGAALPASWEEAQAQVPGLRKWVEVKREAGLTGRREGFDQEVYDLMVQHLRDKQTGLGKWTTSEDGMARNVLRHVDSGLLQELYKLDNPDLPEDIRLPHGQRTGRPIGSLDSEKRAFAPRPNQKPRESREPRVPRVPRVPIPSPEEAREARRIVRRAERAAERGK